MEKYTKKEIITTGVFGIGVVVFLIIIGTVELLREILFTVRKTLFLIEIIIGIFLIPFVLLTPSRPTKKLF